MNFQELDTIVQLEEFLRGVQRVVFDVIDDKDERYKWIRDFLIRFRYYKLSKAQRGIVIKSIIKITGYSRQQVTRLISQYIKTGRICRKQSTVNGFQRKYSIEDIELLAQMDERHDTPCGPALKKLCERAWGIFLDMRPFYLSGTIAGYHQKHPLTPRPKRLMDSGEPAGYF